MAFTEEHLIGKTDESFSKLKWSDFLKWKENKEMILLYQTAGIFHIIPKRLFRSEEDVSDLRSVLTEKLGKQKS